MGQRPIAIYEHVLVLMVGGSKGKAHFLFAVTADFLGKLRALDAGLTFEDDGLRARFSLFR